jgi:large subunit ribosomal protein L23
MRDPRSVIIKPVVSEKSYQLIESNKYVFQVDPRAGKEEIKDAVESIFKVRVVGVNTMHRVGKIKKQGRTQGRTSAMKKAIVTLAQGDKIEFFESK